MPVSNTSPTLALTGFAATFWMDPKPETSCTYPPAQVEFSAEVSRAPVFACAQGAVENAASASNMQPALNTRAALRIVPVTIIDEILFLSLRPVRELPPLLCNRDRQRAYNPL